MTARSRFVARGLLIACAFAVVQFVTSVVYAHVIDGYVGIDASTEIRPFELRVDAVDPASPAYRDGLRPGDVIELAAMSRSDRVDFTSYLKDGKRYRVPIERAGRAAFLTIDMNRNLADDPVWQSLRWQFYLGFCGIMVMIVVAGLLVTKRPESPEVALVSGLLLSVALGENFGPFGAWDTMNDVLTIGGLALSPFLYDGGLALLATYALRFAAPPSRLRRALTWATYAVAAIASVLQALNPIEFWLGRLDESVGVFASGTYVLLVTGLPAALPLACALLGIRDARGEERSRIAWATGALAFLYVAPIAFNVANVAGLDWPLAAAIKNVSFPLAAIGLTYALLGHRLLDVGFALNRAAVFTAVSLVVFGAFSLVEWALGGWLASASRGTNVAVGALLALGLGLAIRPIHSWTDRVIDNVFFRKRHEAERALRTFAKEVTFITDPALVRERTVAIVCAQTDCTAAEILLHRDGTYGAVDENDAALVSLRASHDVVMLRGFDTLVRGEWCFPMSAGGRLIGALVVGPKRLGESFAPTNATRSRRSPMVPAWRSRCSGRMWRTRPPKDRLSSRSSRPSRRCPTPSSRNYGASARWSTSGIRSFHRVMNLPARRYGYRVYVRLLLTTG